MSERITLAQLAAISMLTERTLRSYLKRGLLAGEKTPGGWRFTAEQTAAFLALPQVRSASNARRNAVADDFVQRRMDTTGQLCAVLDLLSRISDKIFRRDGVLFQSQHYRP